MTRTRYAPYSLIRRCYGRLKLIGASLNAPVDICVVLTKPLMCVMSRPHIVVAVTSLGQNLELMNALKWLA